MRICKGSWPRGAEHCTGIYRNSSFRTHRTLLPTTTDATASRALSWATCPLRKQRPALPNAVFQLEALPVSLQREFDYEENARNLTHMIGRSLHTLHNLNDSAAAGDYDHGEGSIIKVLPSWVHLVSWCCVACGCKWAARPANRVDPQVAAFYGCPRCNPSRSGALSLQSAQPSLDTPSCSQMQRFAEVYPLLAGQWDACRNSVVHNKVLFESVADVPLPCSSVVWWICPHCEKSWEESVDSRIQRFDQNKGKENSEHGSSEVNASLCPSCEGRGALLCASGPSGSAATANVKAVSKRRGKGRATKCSELKRFLKDDSILLSEAQLHAYDDPATITLRSNKLLCWKCRWCAYEFVASVADRFLRYKRCPQCTGAKRTPLNLLSIQRPDVLREIASTVPKSKLLKATVHDDTVMPFVCRTCLSTYRMPIRLRCLLPEGLAACPKCVWNKSKFALEVAALSAEGGGCSARPQRKKRRSKDSRILALNELRQRDNGLLN
uniref:Treble clef zinc finger domain-containing protein n=1 Tax=Trypanosoma congolense (strain IL3000) TaxID=1068625 RepID=G0UQJ7_TRYCI|nr:conserved hypothetical protein [Trypanosoma congolense IL3000]